MRRRTLVVLAASTVVLAACQPAQRSYGASNGCGVQLEVAIDDIQWTPSAHITFQPLAPGEHREINDVDEHERTVYLSVRSPGDDRPVEFSLDVAGLPEAPDGAGYDRTVAISGE